MSLDASRLDRLHSVLERLALGEFQARATSSRAHDDLDAIGHAINVLAEEVETSTCACDEAQRAVRVAVQARIDRNGVRGARPLDRHARRRDLMHVLVFEDDARSQRRFRDLLELDGHSVSVAGTMPEGRVRQASAPDLIGIDIHVPGGGGRGLLEAVRSTPKLAAKRVLAVTAFAMQGDRARFLEQGHDESSSKPLSVVGFRGMLAELSLGVGDG